jgi:hypothetical protein
MGMAFQKFFKARYPEANDVGAIVSSRAKKKPRRIRGNFVSAMMGDDQARRTGHALVLTAFGDHIDATAFLVEHDLSIDQCKQGVVLALTHTATGTPFRATLPDQNVAGVNLFTAELLDTATLCIGVATVAAGALTFLMSHESLPEIN